MKLLMPCWQIAIQEFMSMLPLDEVDTRVCYYPNWMRRHESMPLIKIHKLWLWQQNWRSKILAFRLFMPVLPICSKR